MKVIPMTAALIPIRLITPNKLTGIFYNNSTIGEIENMSKKQLVCEKDYERCMCNNYEGCMFNNSDSMSIKEFFIRTRICKNNIETGECDKNTGKNSDLKSFADFAELLWHPKAYVYKTAIEMMQFLDNIENDRILISEAKMGYFNWETLEKCNDLIRADLENRSIIKNTDSRVDQLCKFAKERLSWREEKEKKEIENILNNIDKQIAKRIKLDSDDSIQEEDEIELADINVYVKQEFKKNKKEIDVLLEKNADGNELRACIELKQWTESNLKKVSDIEDVRGFKTLLLNGDEPEGYGRHPLIQASFYAMQYHKGGNTEMLNPTWKEVNAVVDYIKDENSIKSLTKKEREGIKALANELSSEQKDIIKELENDCINNEEAFIYSHLKEMTKQGDVLKSFPLVYLHNQFYDHGILYDDEIKPKELYSFYYNYYWDKSTLAGTLFSRHKCDVLLNTLEFFFNAKLKYEDK